MKAMKAVVFKGKDRIAMDEVPKPTPRAGEAVIRITTTTICGTDVHIVRGEYPVKPGLILGHEPVGVIDELGSGLEEIYAVGQRVAPALPLRRLAIASPAWLFAERRDRARQRQPVGAQEPLDGSSCWRPSFERVPG